MGSNNIKCKYMFMFPLQNLAREVKKKYCLHLGYHLEIRLQ